MNAKDISELWEPLAERCPELRPEHLRLQRTADGCYAHWELAIDAPVRPVTAAALWREAAVRWLVEQTRDTVHGDVRVSIWNDGQFCVELDGMCYFGPTLDHALAAAVRAVLDAQVPDPQVTS